LKYAPLDLALTLKKLYKSVRQRIHYHLLTKLFLGIIVGLLSPSFLFAQIDTLLSPIDLGMQPVFTKLKEALKNPEKVIVLDLGDKELTTFPTEIQKFVNLQKLSLYQNKIKELPEWIGDFERLQWIDVYDNALKELPQSFNKLSHLWYLDLGDNGFKTIPEVVYQLTELRHLYLYGNHLKTLPSEITQLQKLEHLRVGRGFKFLFGGNHLKALPDNFGELSRLQELHLPDNALRTLPESFSKLDRLRFLELGYNRFKQIPPQLKALDSLNYINLWDRNFSESEVSEFKNTHPQSNLQLDKKYEGSFWAVSVAAQQGKFTVAELGIAKAWRKDIFLMAMGLSGTFNLNGKMQSAQGSFWLSGVGFLALGGHLNYFWEDAQNNVGFRPEIGIGTSVWSLTYGHNILFKKGSENIPKSIVAFRLLLPFAPSFSIFK